MKKNFFSVSIFGLMVILGACEYLHLQPACNLQNISYANQVQPIITTRCALPLCHSPANASSLLTISNYSQVIRDTDDIRGYIEHKKMPVGDPLTDCEYHTFIEWLNQGGKNN